MFLAYGCILLNSSLANVLIRLEGAKTTANQAQVEELFTKAPLFLVFITIVILAPLTEEMLFRSLLPKLFPERLQWIGYLLGIILFAILHNPTNLGSFISYAGMATIFALVVYRTGKLEYSIMAHTLNNLMGFIFLLML